MRSPAPISLLEMHLPACFPAPNLGFVCILTSCLKLFQNPIHFWEQHNLKFKKYKRLFLLSDPCFIYNNKTKRLHRMHTQPILRFVQGELGPKWYQWTNEFITLLIQNNPNRRCSGNNRSLFTKPFYIIRLANFRQAITKKRKISYLEEHTFSQDALCMQHKLRPQGPILISIISLPFTQSYYNTCGKCQIIMSRQRLRIQTANCAHIKR